MRILVLHGPNLNLLGVREPGIYGSATLEEINRSMSDLARELDVDAEFYQSNHEGELVDRIQAAVGKFDAILLNAAAYTHTSVAIRDAVAAVKIPVIELHLSNIHAREPFRHTSLLSPVVRGVVMGFGPLSYTLAFRGAVDLLRSEKKA